MLNVNLKCPRDEIFDFLYFHFLYTIKIISITVENCMKNNSKVFITFCVILNNNFNSCCIFKPLASLCTTRNLGTWLINVGHNFSVNVKNFTFN